MYSIKTIIKINNIYTYIIDNLKIFSIMKLLFIVAIISQFVLNISVSNNFVSIFFNLNLFFYYFHISFQARQFRITDQVFLDVHRQDKPLGRIVIGLFGDLAPKAVKNFKILATKGIKGKSYKGTRFNRIIKRFMIQGMCTSR